MVANSISGIRKNKVEQGSNGLIHLDGKKQVKGESNSIEDMFSLKTFEALKCRHQRVSWIMGPELRKRSSTVQINLASVIGCDHSGRIYSTHQRMIVV